MHSENSKCWHDIRGKIRYESSYVVMRLLTDTLVSVLSPNLTLTLTYHKESLAMRKSRCINRKEWSQSKINPDNGPIWLKSFQDCCSFNNFFFN